MSCECCDPYYEYDEDDEPYVPTRTERLKLKIRSRLVRWGILPDTRTVFDKVLQEVYLPAVKEELNRSSMLYEQIEKTEPGKRVVFGIKVGRNG